MDKILVLDFGSQTTQLIARRVRELHVYSEIHPFNMPVEKIRAFAPNGIILSGSPARVIEKNVPHLDERVLQLDVPIMGICYGMQEMARILGGEVDAAPTREYGYTKITIKDKGSLLFKVCHPRESRHPDESRDPVHSLDSGFRRNDITVWMSHNDIVTSVPKGFRITSCSRNGQIASMEDEKGRLFGTQFHPEVTHTAVGKEILKNFVIGICKCKPSWTMKSFVEKTVAEIKKTVGGERVVLGLSGGVDSSVAAVLIHKAIGDQLTCIFVDNGLLRKNEAERAGKFFKEKYHFNVCCVDASQRFLKALSGIEDPEKKRKIIGKEFIEVFENEAKALCRPRESGDPAHAGDSRLRGNDKASVTFLAQGTLYPDVIESVSFRGPSSTIKSHHNVGGLPEKMGLKLLEPLRELFKDEVRELGKELGMPKEAINRQPFPGPGLAVRIIGAVTKEDLDLLREADDILNSEIKGAGFYEKLWQSFCVLLPVKTVGVMGDERTYERVAAIRAVNSTDGMTADWAELPAELLRKISNRIINGVKGINRVVYDISSKPPATIEWE